MPAQTQALAEGTGADATESTSAARDIEYVEAEDNSSPDGDNAAANSSEGAASTELDPGDTTGQSKQRDAAVRRKFTAIVRPSRRFLLQALVPAIVLLLALGAGYLKWQDMSYRESKKAAAESIQAATDATVAMLTYHHETVDKDLNAARDRLAGSFRDDYTKLINTVVIPGSREKNVSVVAKVSLAGSVSATANHAVVLVFVDQTTTFGPDAPTDSASSVLVTLDKEGGKWLVSKFDPV